MLVKKRVLLSILILLFPGTSAFFLGRKLGDQVTYMVVGLLSFLVAIGYYFLAATVNAPGLYVYMMLCGGNSSVALIALLEASYKRK